MSDSDQIQIGSIADIVGRLKAVLPGNWFPAPSAESTASESPVLDGVLSGIASAWTFCFKLLQFVRMQTRLSTAYGSFLDMFCVDFFGLSFKRQVGEDDDKFRARLSANLLTSRATRGALAQALGVAGAPSSSLFEPTRAADTGGYGSELIPTLGGGGGYSTSALRRGSSGLSFGCLIAIPSGIGTTSRQSCASYLDQVGQMQIAMPGVLRPLYPATSTSAYLVEDDGVNLIKDSVGWSGFTGPPTGGSASWSVDQMGRGGILAGHSVMQITIGYGGPFAGPRTTLFCGQGEVTGSVWLYIPGSSGIQSINLKLQDDLGINVSEPADLNLLDRWQRINATLLPGKSTGRWVTMSLEGQAAAQTSSPLFTQCWQVEEGSVATSYIHSDHQIGIRDSDKDVVPLLSSGLEADQQGLNQVIAQVMPAGAIGWVAFLE